MRGFFISLEGGDGSGKTTQAKRLANSLEGAGLPVVATREPGGTRLGEAVRAIVLDPANEDMSPWAEAQLYTAARAQLLREVILPHLARGSVVVADRFADSTLAYQGAGRGLEIAVLGAMQAVLKVKPDLTFLFDLDPRMGFARQAADGSRPDRIEREDIVFHERVRQGYLDGAKREPDRFHVVDAEQAPDQVAAEVMRVAMARAEAHGLKAGVAR